MFWKLVKYELQSVRKWYLGIYGIAILLSIPLGLMLQKLTVTFEHIHKEPSLLFMAFFTLIVIATIVVWEPSISQPLFSLSNALRLVSLDEKAT